MNDNKRLKELEAMLQRGDLVFVKRAKWTNEKYLNGLFKKDYTCSSCGRHIQVSFDCNDVVKYVPYCHCGRKMEI